MAIERCDPVSIRRIKRLVTGRPSVDRAGVKLVRVFAAMTPGTLIRS